MNAILFHPITYKTGNYMFWVQRHQGFHKVCPNQVESFCSFKLLLVNYAQMLNFTQILEVAPVQISWQVFQ